MSYEIRWIVDRHHVGTDYLAIARDLWRRGLNTMPRSDRREIISIAFKRHAENRDMYRHVTGSI